MGVKVKTKKDSLYKMSRSAEALNGKRVNVGVLEGEHAWLAGIHEYGCRIKVTPKMRAYLHSQGLHLKNSTTEIVIPERSFLRGGFDSCHKQVVKKTEKTLEKALHGEIAEDVFFRLVGLMLQSEIQNFARNVSSPPNHPFTVGKKGSSSPLVDTGDMIGAIAFEVE